MPISFQRVATALTLVAALGACEKSAPVEPPQTLTQVDAATLAQVVDHSTSNALGTSSTFHADGGRGNVEFTVTRECPKGGSVTVQGKRTVAIDHATKTGTVSETATRTDKACAHEGRNGIVLTKTGDPNVVVSSTQTVTNGTRGARTTTHKGAYKWSTSDGKSGRCVVDFTATFDPATKTHTVKGIVCNHAVDKTSRG